MSDVTIPATGSVSTQETARRVGRYARYVFWLMFVINFLNYLDRWIFTGLSAIIQQDLRIDDFHIGLLTSGFLIVYTIVALPLGFLAERVARKIIVGVGVAIWSVATVMTCASLLASLDVPVLPKPLDLDDLLDTVQEEMERVAPKPALH